MEEEKEEEEQTRQDLTGSSGPPAGRSGQSPDDPDDHPDDPDNVPEDSQSLLTEAGRAKAEAIYERHLLLSRFLESVLGISPETASQDACRIEHIISDETFDGVKAYLKAHGKECENDGTEQ